MKGIKQFVSFLGHLHLYLIEGEVLCTVPGTFSDGKYQKLLYRKSCVTEMAVLNHLISTTWPDLSVDLV